MFEPVWRSALAVIMLATGTAGAPMREPTAVKLLSTSHSAFRIVQGGREIGEEAFDKRTYNNNTIVFQATMTLAPAPGVNLDESVDLTLEEESYFPRSFRSSKKIAQGAESFTHTISVDMYANVAVVESELRGTRETRRVVVPAGIAVQSVGAVFYWYQTLFWYDREQGGRQRFQWLDPVSTVLGSGEIRMTGEETLVVLGKKTKVAVFNAEREKLGASTIYVDAKGRIVKCEQNMTTFELVEQSDK